MDSIKITLILRVYTLLVLYFTPLCFYLWNCLTSSFLSKLWLMNHLTETCIYSQKAYDNVFIMEQNLRLFETDSCQLMYTFSAQILYDLRPTVAWKRNHFTPLLNLHKNEKKITYYFEFQDGVSFTLGPCKHRLRHC